MPSNIYIPPFTYTPAEKKRIFYLLDRLVTLANGFGQTPPKRSVVAHLNNSGQIEEMLALETREARQLIQQWFLESKAVNTMVFERYEMLVKSQINITA